MTRGGTLIQGGKCKPLNAYLRNGVICKITEHIQQLAPAKRCNLK